MAVSKFSTNRLSSKLGYSSLLAGNQQFLGIRGAYDSIATVTVASNASSVDFTSIPQTYKHLQIRGIARTAQTGQAGGAGLSMFFNNSGASNHANHAIGGDGTNASTRNDTSNNYIPIRTGAVRAATTSGTYGASIVDIIDYSSTTKNKTFRVFSGNEYNDAPLDILVSLGSGLLISTTAITSISISNVSYDLVPGTTFALYGIKGA